MPSVLRANELTPAHTSRLYSVLRGYGGSYLGAQQLLRGEVITNPRDRAAIARLARHTTAFMELEWFWRKIDVTWGGGGMSNEDSWNCF
jgi:hypothetical protein